MKSKTLLLILFCCLVAQPCAAQEVFSGSWDITKSEPAPWLAARPDLKPHPEPTLRHARFVFRADRVVAPAWMGCKRPKYEMMQLNFDSLFEGMLFDPDHHLDDPRGLALKLGFTKEPAISMLTGCTELLFHLVDKETVMFGLNNMIYTLKRHHPT